jgi:transglycosylase-like protein with SLT domain/peptidase M23-like protein
MRRKLFFCLLTAALFVAGFGAASFPAIAQLRVITVKLVGGQRITTTVDVPPNTPLDQIQLPEITAPIESISEGAPAAPDVPDPRHEQLPEEKSALKHEAIEESQGEPKQKPQEEQTSPDSQGGAPDPHDPTLSVGLPGPAPIGVPNFIISKFRIPPFLLPLYQAAGVQYGIRWEVLAAINEIETDYGRNLNVSSAGAVGWMQFLPSSWRTYGVDANRDGQKDPYNPVDAIFAAGRYLKAAGSDKSLRRSIFAYNHADWYVDSVLMRARLIAGVPADVVGSLTGLTQGHFPVHANARYADDLAAEDVRRLGRRVRRAHNAAKLVESRDHRRSINIFSRRGAPVIAVNDGVVKKLGVSKRLGRYVVLQDVYGNRYLYAHLGEVSKRYPVPREKALARPGRNEFHPARTTSLPKPTGPASAGTQVDRDSRAPSAVTSRARTSSAPPVRKERLFANPARENSAAIAEETGQFTGSALDKSGSSVFRVYFSRVFRLSPDEVQLKPLRKGAKVVAGTILGRTGKLSTGPGSKLAPHLNFSIRPAGRGAPRIDPKPILDGWKLLEATAVYRAAGRNPFLGPNADQPLTGHILLMSKETLARRVLANPRVDVYPCGQSDIRSGQVDRRVLATLEFLAASGLRPTVTSLKCGHSYYTTSGGVSHHSSGNAVDISKVNGIPIIGHQGPGSITDFTIRRLLTLQGTVQPDQIISLMEMGGPTFAMADHADHIHVGFRPLYGTNDKLGRQARRLLSNNQWDKLVSRIGDIRNPIVRTKPSKYSIKVRPRHRASRAHRSE